jgi:site-specific recombinase XerD
LRTNRVLSVSSPGNFKPRHTFPGISARPSLAPPTLQRFETYLRRHALSPATIRNYLADLRAFARWHTNRKSSPNDLAPADFRAYRAHLCDETDHSPATINRRLQSLRLFGRFLHETAQVADNPARGLALVHNGNSRALAPRTLTRTEVARLLTAARDARPSLAARDLAIAQLMLQAGLRVHQIATLRVDDIILPRRDARVRVHSNGAPRDIPLNALTVRALRDYLPMRPTIPHLENLFLSQRGQPLAIRSIQRLVDASARAAGLPNVSAQTLRHTCAQNMLTETHDAATVARWLGHRDVRMVERYLKTGTRNLALSAVEGT